MSPLELEEHQTQLSADSPDWDEVVIQCSCGWGNPALKGVRVFHPSVADAYMAWGVHMYDFGYQVGWRTCRDQEDW